MWGVMKINLRQGRFSCRIGGVWKGLEAFGAGGGGAAAAWKMSARKAPGKAGGLLSTLLEDKVEQGIPKRE